MTNNLNITRRKTEKLSVLVVDDESDIRETLKMFLEMMEVFNFIVEASNGADALAKCQVQKFDVIITDLMMPKVKGIEFVQNFKQYEKSKGIKKPTPIIILSANITSDEVKQAINMGVKHALTKPCTAEDFVEKMNEVLIKDLRDKVIVKQSAAG